MATSSEPRRLQPSRVARAWREGGLPLLLRRGTQAVFSPLMSVGHIEFMARTLGPDDAGPPKVPDGIVLEEVPATAAGMLLMGRERPDVVAAEIRRRFERGDRCIIARNSDGRYLHSRWVSTFPTLLPELGRCIAPSAGQAYMYDGYTRPEARGQGVDGLVRLYIFHAAHRLGFREVISYVQATNAVGLKAARKWQVSIGRVHYAGTRRAGPWCFAAPKVRRRVRLIPLSSASAQEAERQSRADALRDWFNSWLVEPMEKRSTGFVALPEEYFRGAGEHIVAALALNPECDRVLDVGCSSGGISRHVAPAAHTFTGVDLTAGLVADIKPGSITTASGAAAEFSVADATNLPFAADSFDKVYCTGVIHMLPARGDAMRAVHELVRVCRPGGIVLLGAVPDEAKRWKEYGLLWRNASLSGKAHLAAAISVPRPLKRLVRRALRRPSTEVAFLKFDLERMRADFEERGFIAELLHYPDDYWSEDFRTTRSCLRLRLPGVPEHA